MAEEKHKHEEKKEHEHSHEHAENKHENQKHENKEIKEDHKHEKKTAKTEPKIKKYEAFARGVSLHMSKKQATYICSFIKKKPVDRAIKELNEVIAYKRAIPFKGEIPHRKGKGMMSGRYPITASKYFVNLLKGLKGNIIVEGLDLNKTRIYIASASWASRPA